MFWHFYYLFLFSESRIVQDMNAFLKQVAVHYFTTSEIDRKCFVFPNRRSMVFFQKYLCEVVKETAAADKGQDPVIAPEMITINDFFYKASGFPVTDRVTLLLELYKVYSSLYKNAESLDDFIFWGDIILADFNDIDKYMADACQLFRNISDFKEIQDTYSYLTENQRTAIEAFIRNFKDGEGRLTVNIDSENPNVKERFLQIWNILYPLYDLFNKNLTAANLAYEGMVYRKFATELQQSDVSEILGGSFPARDGFVFVGLNALNECEKTVLRKMRDSGVAEFCWDYSGDLIRDTANKSSFFMADNVKEFPSSFKTDPEGVTLPHFHIVSVPSSVGQVKQVPRILSEIASGQAEGMMSRVGSLAEGGVGCAIVIPDESLLVPLLNSIPVEVDEINVTMGYPMSDSELFNFMSMVAAMQLHVILRDGQHYFYHRQVWDLFSTGIFRKCQDEDAVAVVDRIRKEARYYIPVSDFKGSVLTETVFRPVLTDVRSADSGQIDVLASYLSEMVRTVGSLLSDDMGMALELEFAHEYYKCLNMLAPMRLEILPLTFVHLLNQLLSGVSVPFKGEPLKGLQIMGPLETRALDFRNVVILSANEGVFPRKSVSSSFVPPELRKGFGLPTYEYQDAVWAYYFYRMITRAENVWMVYDSRTEGMKSGEESRYIKQLKYHFGLDLEVCTLSTGIMNAGRTEEIVKTPEDVDKIKGMELSASSIQNYLDCPAKFYYSSIKGLKAEEEVKEVVDNGIFGTVFHDTMAALYSGEEAMSPDFVINRTFRSRMSSVLDRVSVGYIKSWIGRKDEIRARVRSLILSGLNMLDLSGRNLVVVDVIVEYVIRTLKADLKLMEERKVDALKIVGIERLVTGHFHGQRFKGFIDRMDSFGDGDLRIVDYKTGKVLKDDEYIDDGNAEKIAAKIFTPDVSERPGIALQFFIYDMLMDGQGGYGSISNSVYSVSRLFRSVPEVIPQNIVFRDLMKERLTEMLDEMYNLEVPFRRAEVADGTGRRSVCDYCDFKVICGR